jgi:hypothetical protein
MRAGALLGQDGGDGGHSAADDDAMDTEQIGDEIPDGWATVRVAAKKWRVSVGTVRRYYGEYKTLPFRRLPDGRIIVNANEVPRDLIKETKRHQTMMEEVRQEIVQSAGDTTASAYENASAMQVIRRHVRWLEQTIEELQNRHAEYERERRRMEQAHRAERQQLLAIVASLTNAASPAPEPSPRRTRRKATETG